MRLLGLSVEAVADEEIRGWLGRIQHDLFSLGASLATPGSEDGTARPATPPLPEGRIEQMEDWIDGATGETPELQSFILPGGTRGAACSASCSDRLPSGGTGRGEAESGSRILHPVVLKYLNRLSDLLFALARLENWRQGVPDVPWEKEED